MTGSHVSCIVVWITHNGSKHDIFKRRHILAVISNWIIRATAPQCYIFRKLNRASSRADLKRNSTTIRSGQRHCYDYGITWHQSLRQRGKRGNKRGSVEPTCGIVSVSASTSAATAIRLTVLWPFVEKYVDRARQHERTVVGGCVEASSQDLTPCRLFADLVVMRIHAPVVCSKRWWICCETACEMTAIVYHKPAHDLSDADRISFGATRRKHAGTRHDISREAWDTCHTYGIPLSLRELFVRQHLSKRNHECQLDLIWTGMGSERPQKNHLPFVDQHVKKRSVATTLGDLMRIMGSTWVFGVAYFLGDLCLVS